MFDESEYVDEVENKVKIQESYDEVSRCTKAVSNPLEIPLVHLKGH